jgi:hypothetical protein
MFVSVALAIAFHSGSRAVRSCAVVLHMLVLWAAVAPAQLYLGADATVAWPYVWRGLTRANCLTAAPEGFLTVEAYRTFLSAGGWWNFERGATTSRLSDRNSTSAGLAEFDWWVQGARRFGSVDASLGFIHYGYSDTIAAAGRPTRVPTREIYATLRASWKYLAPGISAYWDRERVRGWYIETYTAVPVFASPWVGPPSFWIFVTALVGYSAGQGVNPADPMEAANFAGNHFTHGDLSVALGAPRFLKRPGTSWQVDGHVQVNLDSLTQRTSAAPVDRRLRFFIKASVRWTQRFLSW